jgi:hypothetical protein
VSVTVLSSRRAIVGIAAVAIIGGASAAWGVGHRTHNDGSASHDAHVASVGGLPARCANGWTCVRAEAAKLGLKVADPANARGDRFVDSHDITDGGLEFAFTLPRGERVIVFAVPVGSPAAKGQPGNASASVDSADGQVDSGPLVVRGRAAVWLRNGSQDVLTWREAGLRYREWFPATVTERDAVATTSRWIARLRR